jgi:RNA polymerase sigma-70 factor (ECF subfamily)
MPISDRPDGELVRDILGGHVESFNVLVRRWERKIYTYVSHLTRQSEDAFDLCQEVFVSAYQHLDRLREPEKFSPWLFRIARNAAYSHLRRLQDQNTLSEANAPPSPSELRLGDGQAWGRGELKLLVGKALDKLPIEQREAVLLKIFHGFNFAEIAEIQGCPQSTVKTRVYTGFDQLRKFLVS